MSARHLPALFRTAAAFLGAAPTMLGFVPGALGAACLAYFRTDATDFMRKLRATAHEAGWVQQIAAHSRSSRMHPAILATSFSPRQAVAQCSQAWAQRTQESMHERNSS